MKNRRREQARSVKLDVSGFSHIFESRLSPKARLFWLILCVTVTGLLLKQCYERVEYFITVAPTVNTKYRLNGSLSFPMVIICPTTNEFTHPAVWPYLLHERFGNVSYSNMFELMNKAKMNAEDLWNISRFPTDDVRILYAKELSTAHGLRYSNDSLQKTDFTTMLGTCWLLKIGRKIPYTGPSTCLRIEAKTAEIPSLRFYRVAFLTEENLPLIKYTIAFEAQYMAFNLKSVIKIRVHLNTFLNTWKRPCQSVEKFIECQIKSIEKNIFSNVSVSCRLPFMMASSLRLCETPKEFQAIYEVTDEVLKEFKLDENMCACPKKCSDVLYKVDGFFTSGNTTDLIFVAICFATNEIEIVNEDYPYNFWALMSDIGGSLGMFVGICVLQIFEIISTVLLQC